MYKLAVLSGLLVSATCTLLHQPIPVAIRFQYHDTPNYNFAYEVNDANTGDIKSQRESRRGESVQGQYSLLQPDGVRRTVDYRADEHVGFRATVNNEGRSINENGNGYQNADGETRTALGDGRNQAQVQQQQQQPALFPERIPSYPQANGQSNQLSLQTSSTYPQPYEANLGYLWPAPVTVAPTPAPAVAVSRSSIVQTFSNNPWA